MRWTLGKQHPCTYREGVHRETKTALLCHALKFQQFLLVIRGISKAFLLRKVLSRLE